MLFRWLHKLPIRKTRPTRNARRARPRLEVLEDRLTPTTLMWTGDVDNLWNTNLSGNTNWLDLSLGVDSQPQGGEDLLFPASGANHTNTNDISGPALTFNSITFTGIDYVISGNPVGLPSGTSLSDTSTSGANQLNLDIALPPVIDVAVSDASTTLTLGGVLSADANLSKSGAGTLVLTNVSTYAGNTDVAAGTLLVNGTIGSPATVESGATLGGTGTVGDVLLLSGGTLSAGPVTAILNTGNLTFSGGSNLLVDINSAPDGSQYDVLNVSGAVALSGPGNPNLTINLGFVPTPGTPFSILLNDLSDAISGPPSVTFNGVPEGGTILSSGTQSGRPFSITYVGGDGNDVVLTFENSAPANVTITPTPATPDEGQQVTFNGSFTDDDPGDTHTVVIDFGNGTSTMLSLGAGVTTFGPVTNVYLDNSIGTAPFVATATVMDNNGGSGTGSSAVFVNNVSPANIMLSFVPSPIDEGGTVRLNGSFSDPGVLDSHTVVIDWGDGTTPDTLNLASGVGNFTMTHLYVQNNPGNAPFTVTVTVTDKDGGQGTASAPLVVNEVPPAIGSLTVTPNPVNENDSVTLNGTFSDPGTLDAHTVVINWGDGSANTTINLGAGVLNFSAPHQYLDNQLGNAPFTITVTASDGGGAGTATTPAAVNNVAPSVVRFNLVPTVVNVGGSVGFEGAFTDPGTQDTFVLTINWGDGTVQTFSYPASSTSGTVPIPFSPAGPLLHTYLTPGTFTVTAQLADDDGGTFPFPARTITVNAPPQVFLNFGNAINRFVQFLYADVLGRSPDAVGFNHWGLALSTGRLTRAEVATQFLVSPERLGLVVDQFYAEILGRPADAPGRAHWVALLSQGLDESEVALRFVTSPEFTASHPTNESYVAGLYAVLFGRQAPPAEIALHLPGMFLGATRADIATTFLNSDEAVIRAIDENYRTYLRREESDAERRDQFNAIVNAGVSPVGVQVAFLASEEYFQLVQRFSAPSG